MPVHLIAFVPGFGLRVIRGKVVRIFDDGDSWGCTQCL